MQFTLQTNVTCANCSSLVLFSAGETKKPKKDTMNSWEAENLIQAWHVHLKKISGSYPANPNSEW